MKLNRLFSYFYIVKFFLVSILGVLAFITLENYTDQIDTEKLRMQSYIIAKEIEENTNSLTRFARMYVATSDTSWKTKYYELLDAGWGQRSEANGMRISMLDSLKRLGATDKEIAKIKEAKEKYKDAFLIEEKAFNAMKGRFADQNGDYTLNSKPDRQFAQSLMFGKEYEEAKAIIMKPIKEFMVMIEKRTNDDYKHNNVIRDHLIWSKITIILIILSTMTLGFVIMRVRLIKRNDELEVAYKDLEESEERYKTLFENSPDGYLTIVDGKFNTFNKSAQKMMLADDKYLTGKAIDEISPKYQPDGKTSEKAKVEEIKKTLMYGTQKFEWIHTRCDGTDFTVEVSLSSITLNGKPAFLATWRDATQRKKIEQDLREGEKNLKIAQEIANMGSWEINLGNRELMMFKEASKIFGINDSKNYIMPEEIALTIPLPEYHQLIQDSIRDLVEKNKEYNIEFRAKRFDNGEVVWIHSKAEVEYLPSGKPYKILGIVQDITERKNIEQALRKSETDLKELNAAKDKFFSIVSHDLKGPYNALLNLSEILVEEYDELSEEETKNFIHSIDDIVSNSYKLLENLLEWSRLQTGVLSYNPEKINIKAELNPTIKLLENTAQAKGINFIYSLAPTEEIFADKYMLDTIVRNLVSNAIKFTHANGNISLSFQKTRENYIISVTDDGVGMPPKKVKSLFRMDKTKTITTKGTENETGTGLGLILCKEMVEMHGGKVWVDSELGSGTTFTFNIPIEEEKTILIPQI